MEKKKTYIKRGLILSFFLLSAPRFVFAADLLIRPISGNYTVGDRISVRVVVTGSESINAISGNVSIPPIFTIESVTKAGSMLNFWIAEPSFSRTLGIVNFEGVSLSGFIGYNSLVITINLKAINTGSGKITFQTGQILANDGQGTNVTGSLNSGNFEVFPFKEAPKKTTEQAPKVTENPVEIKVVDELQPAPSLIAPLIKPGKENGLSAVIGSSDYPKADVLLTFLSQSGSKVFITGNTDNDGGFNLIIPQSLRDGEYSVSALIVLADGKNSPPSNILNIKLGGEFYGGLSWKSSTYIGFTTTLILLFASLYLLWRRFGSNKRDILRREVKEAEDVLHKSFGILREDLEDPKISPSFKKDLKDAEAVIKKEIEDIKKIPLDE